MIIGVSVGDEIFLDLTHLIVPASKSRHRPIKCITHMMSHMPSHLPYETCIWFHSTAISGLGPLSRYISSFLLNYSTIAQTPIPCLGVYL